MTPKQKYRYRRGAESEWNWCRKCKWRQQNPDWPSEFRDWTVTGTCLEFERVLACKTCAARDEKKAVFIMFDHTCAAFKKRRVTV